MKIKYRLLPVEPYEVSALETWLSDLSAQGLYLLEIKSFYAAFRVKEPKRMLSRLEPKNRREEFPEQNKLQLYKDYGWKYVTAFGNYFYVYAGGRKRAGNLYRPMVESELYQKYAHKNLRLKGGLA